MRSQYISICGQYLTKPGGQILRSEYECGTMVGGHTVSSTN